jgi:VanZ family protein
LNPSHRRILKVWLPSAIWLIVIAIESTNLGSAENTSRILYPLFHYLFGIEPVRFSVWHHVLRKAGHFAGYFTLSILLFRSWAGTFPRFSTRWCLQWATLAFLSTALVASLDEWHQSFLPSRTGLFTDVLLDCTAGVIAQIAIFFVRRGSRLGVEKPAAEREEVCKS